MKSSFCTIGASGFRENICILCQSFYSLLVLEYLKIDFSFFSQPNGYHYFERPVVTTETEEALRQLQEIQGIDNIW